MQPKRRQKDRPRRSFFRPPPAAAAGAISRPGASALFVSDGDNFAPRRELLLSAVTKVAKSTGRNYVSALPQRAMADSDFPHLLAVIAFHHRCRSKGLCLRSPARRLTRPLASATVGVFRSYRRSGRGYFAPRARERVSDGSLLSTATKVTKSAGRNYVSALPQRATPVRRRPRFPSRNRRFPDRCRSPDCASTAFRCRCLLLRQKLFVLPCRRLRNNYILCPTGTPTFAALRRQRRDLIIAKNDQRTSPYPHCISGSGASAFFVSDGPISSNSGRNGGKNAGRNYVSALPQRAMPVRCRPRFPSRNRHFLTRCRSPDCASTAFRCRCLLLW